MKYFFYFELKCSLLPNDLGVIGCHWQGKEDWTDVLRLFWAILVYIWHENIKTRSNQNAFDVWKFDHWGFFYCFRQSGSLPGSGRSLAESLSGQANHLRTGKSWIVSMQQVQCDQMVILFVYIWPLATMKIGPFP